MLLTRVYNKRLIDLVTVYIVYMSLLLLLLIFFIFHKKMNFHSCRCRTKTLSFTEQN